MGRLSWRNLWRNRRRTGLTAGGIAFAVLLLCFAMSQQAGSYRLMIENGTTFMTGQIQIQAAGYQDDPRVERLVPDAQALRERVEALPGVQAAAERVQAFALVSAGERTVAAQIIGVDPEREPEVSKLPGMVRVGQFFAAYTLESQPLDTRVPVMLGSGVARNLGVELGAEVVLLGTQPEGGIAALVGVVSGILDTGQAELDRSLLLAPLDQVRQAWALDTGAHALVVRTTTVDAVPDVQRGIETLLDEGIAVLPWQTLLPELEQTIAFDRVSNRLFYGLLALLVSFSIVNSFVMVVFERTREFGLLMAMGMRPWRLLLMLELEALWLALLGVALGALLAWPLVAWTSAVGLPLGESAGMMLRRFHLPDRMYAALDAAAFVEPMLLMTAATLVAALLPALRVRRLSAVEALHRV
jgi:ABC-type lipoprotein release transport system permease subunit